MTAPDLHHDTLDAPWSQRLAEAHERAVRVLAEQVGRNVRPRRLRREAVEVVGWARWARRVGNMAAQLYAVAAAVTIVGRARPAAPRQLPPEAHRTPRY